MVSHVQKTTAFNKLNEKKKSKKKEKHSNLECNNKKTSKKNHKNMDDAQDKISSDMSATDPVPKKKKKMSNKELSDVKEDADVSNITRDDVPKKKKRKHADIESSDFLTKADVPKKKKRKQAKGTNIGSSEPLTKADVPKKKKKKQASGEGFDSRDFTADNVVPNMEINKNVSSKDIDVNINNEGSVAKKKKEKNGVLKVNKKKKKGAKKEATCVLVSEEAPLDNKLEATAVLPLHQNTETHEVFSTTNSVTGSETKKEKKRKRKSCLDESNLVMKNVNAIDDGVLPQKEREKKKKDQPNENEVTVVLKPQKGKKKKRKIHSEESDEVKKSEIEETEICILKKEKKKKRKKKPEKDSDLTNCDNVVNDILPQLRKKEKPEKGTTKSKNVVSDVLRQERKKNKYLSEKCDEVKMDETEVPLKVKKKLKAQPEENTEVTQSENVDIDVSVTQAEKRKKKEAITEIGVEATVSDVTSSAVEDDVSVVDGSHLGGSFKTGKTEKRKKRVSFYEEPQDSGTLPQNVSDMDSSQDLDENRAKEVEIKGKKKNKEDLPAESGQHQHMNPRIEEDKKTSKKEKEALLNKEQEIAEALNDIPKKKKKKKESKKISKIKTARSSDQQDGEDVHVVSGNADEVQINAETKFGQWGTATFQSTEQQTKFFRLLGGFKKGNQAAMSPSPMQKKPNMALGKEGEQTLERSLLAEFDQALTRKQNRGIGLGFQPEQKKTFYIDKTASKSTRFED